MIETIMVKDISILKYILSHERLYKFQEKAMTITKTRLVDSTFSSSNERYGCVWKPVRNNSEGLV